MSRVKLAVGPDPWVNADVVQGRLADSTVQYRVVGDRVELRGSGTLTVSSTTSTSLITLTPVRPSATVIVPTSAGVALINNQGTLHGLTATSGTVITFGGAYPRIT